MSMLAKTEITSISTVINTRKKFVLTFWKTSKPTKKQEKQSENHNIKSIKNENNSI